MAAFAAALMAPLPQRVYAPLIVEYRDAERVYVTVPGQLAAEVQIGEGVQAGQVLRGLTNSEVELELARLRSDRDRQKLYLKNLDSQRLQGVIDGSQIPTATAALADLEKRFEQLECDAAESDARGAIARHRAAGPACCTRGKARRRISAALDGHSARSNKLRPRIWKRGALVCLVGDPTQFEAIVHVDEADVEFVRRRPTRAHVARSFAGRDFSGHRGRRRPARS